MSYSIEVMPLATAEIIDAYDWYEEQKENLGLDFLNELDKFYTGLQINPTTHSFYDQPVRHGKVDRFPYTVVYESFEQTKTIMIYSVFMEKQHPNKKRSK